MKLRNQTCSSPLRQKPAIAKKEGSRWKRLGGKQIQQQTEVKTILGDIRRSFPSIELPKVRTCISDYLAYKKPLKATDQCAIEQALVVGCPADIDEDRTHAFIDTMVNCRLLACRTTRHRTLISANLSTVPLASLIERRLPTRRSQRVLTD